MTRRILFPLCLLVCMWITPEPAEAIDVRVKGPKSDLRILPVKEPTAYPVVVHVFMARDGLCQRRGYEKRNIPLPGMLHMGYFAMDAERHINYTPGEFEIPLGESDTPMWQDILKEMLRPDTPDRHPVSLWNRFDRGFDALFFYFSYAYVIMAEPGDVSAATWQPKFADESRKPCGPEPEALEPWKAPRLTFPINLQPGMAILQYGSHEVPPGLPIE